MEKKEPWEVAECVSMEKKEPWEVAECVSMEKKYLLPLF
jgi:hypothetical protein